MINNLCPHCGGKGFEWQAGTIASRVDGRIEATAYRHGPKCQACNGTGRRDLSALVAAVCGGLGVLVFAITYALCALIKG